MQGGVLLNSNQLFNNMKVKRKCEICGKIFYKMKSSMRFRPARFCSHHCRNNYFALMPKIIKCKACGKKIKVRNGSKSKYCSQKCYWKFLKGLHKKNNTEYKVLRINGKNKREHKVIMEKYLGRKLKKSEIVHHINGDRADNKIENLQVVSRKEHIEIHFEVQKIKSQCKPTKNQEQ